MLFICKSIASSFSERDSMGQTLIVQRLHVCLLSVAMVRKCLQTHHCPHCKPSYGHVDSAVQEQEMIYEVKEDSRLNQPARSLLRDCRPPFSENDTKRQETINLFSFLHLHPPPHREG